MNYAARPPKSVQAIDLASEPDFSLGRLLICPSLRELRMEGRTISVEPRVMQMLVVLVRSGGAVISRDQLIERCWGGRVVGDDAINACVAKVRLLPGPDGNPAFKIETIPRVGYRLLQLTPPIAVDESVQPDTWNFSVRQLRWPAAGLLLVGAIVVFLLVFAGRPPEWVIAESHQAFISTPLIERYPAFSPDGTIVAYSAGPNVLSRQIYLRLMTGGDSIRLTSDPFDAYSPSWSPDGRTIAYLGYVQGQPCRILLAGVPAGASRLVARCRTSMRSSLTWDHEGHALLYADSPSGTKAPRIMRLDLASGATQELTHPESSGGLEDSSPAVSPNGKTLLFSRDLSGTTTQIVLHSLAGGAERELMHGSDEGLDAAWSMDSSTVFVARDRPDDPSLWAYPFSGGAPWRISASAIPVDRLSSGPGGLLAMELEFVETDIAAASANPGRLPQLLDQLGLNACNFDYAPDGTLVLIAHRSGTTSAWLRETDGHFHELLQLRADRTCGIRWSPDGTRFAYGEGSDHSFDVQVVSRSGAPVARIDNPTRDFGWIDWSADGRSLLLSRLDAHGWRLWRTTLSEPHTASPASPYGWQVVQPYGDKLFGTRQGSAGVWRMDGTPKRLTDWPTVETPWLWTIWNGRIVYADCSNASRPVFVAQPIGGGAKTVIGYPAGLSIWGNVAVDPRTGLVTYLRWKRDDTDIGWIRLVRR